LLLGRAGRRPVGAEHAAVAGFRLQDFAAAGAVIEVPARVDGHCLDCAMPAARTGQRALQFKGGHDQDSLGRTTAPRTGNIGFMGSLQNAPQTRRTTPCYGMESEPGRLRRSAVSAAVRVQMSSAQARAVEIHSRPLPRTADGALRTQTQVSSYQPCNTPCRSHDPAHSNRHRNFHPARYPPVAERWRRIHRPSSCRDTACLRRQAPLQPEPVRTLLRLA